jgi:hypothetical protein
MDPNPNPDLESECITVQVQVQVFWIIIALSPEMLDPNPYPQLCVED